ncbi:MAG: hypothetical protein E8D46_15065 [Nitrospira sp.]|nr:MAG: hypothetical protein E8D46_15065 [Nitrospira sp.]
MNKIYQSFAIFVFLSISLLGCEQESRVVGDTNPVRVAKLQQTHRDLWLGHIILVQHFVLYNQTKNQAEQATAEKEVVANAKQIAISMTPFYGEARAEKFFTLLVGHVAAVKEYSAATVVGNKPRQDAALLGLATNADDLALFLNGANPYLPKDAFRGLIAAHGAHHVLQINLYQKKEYARLEATWPMMREHAYVIADALTTALVKQFPTEFS